MKHIAYAALIALFVTPAAAQDAGDDGFDLMEEGAKLLLRGLMTEMEPVLEDMEDFASEIGPAMKMLADEMGPALAEVLNAIDDIRNYDAPQIMPNGDIIIRRRTDAPAFDLPEDIEL